MNVTSVIVNHAASRRCVRRVLLLQMEMRADFYETSVRLSLELSEQTEIKNQAFTSKLSCFLFRSSRTGTFEF